MGQDALSLGSEEHNHLSSVFDIHKPESNIPDYKRVSSQIKSNFPQNFKRAEHNIAMKGTRGIST